MITDRIELVLGSSHAITVVTDGDTAIQHLLSNDYDCVLLDLMLPHLSGFDVLRTILMRAPKLLKKTIIMTAATDESLQFIDRGAVGGILRKPFEVGALPGLVAALITPTPASPPAPAPPS
jgi:DNA-binding response OmpR family regulator